MSNKELLDALAAKVVACIKCDLWKCRKNAVPGIGNPESKIMFIGEAPGKSEDLKGEPFVGSAGRFLDYLLPKRGLSRADIFITNIVKCRPPLNRDPRPIEIETCTPYLNRQIAIIRPKLIVTMGRHPTAYVLSKTHIPFRSITQARGKVYEAKLLGLKLRILPTFHPAASLYSGKYRKQLIEDFKEMEGILLRSYVKTES